MFKSEPSSPNTALLLLVPIRLGSDSLNIIYIPCIKVGVVTMMSFVYHVILQALLAMEYCIGIIGGRPKHSVYFVGFQENKLLYLDPHYVQKRVDMSRPDFDLKVLFIMCVCFFNCMYYVTMHICMYVYVLCVYNVHVCMWCMFNSVYMCDVFVVYMCVHFW